MSPRNDGAPEALAVAETDIKRLKKIARKAKKKERRERKRQSKLLRDEKKAAEAAKKNGARIATKVAPVLSQLARVV